jgi:hypothetical protein
VWMRPATAPRGQALVLRKCIVVASLARVKMSLVWGQRPALWSASNPDRRFSADVLLAMKRQSLIPAVFVLLLAAGGLPAAAQSTDRDKAARVEVTPYASLGSYPSSRVGVAVLFPLTPILSVESEVGYHHDVTSALSMSASLLFGLPRIGRVMPYLAAGAGLEQYATAFRLPGGALAAQQRTAFTINAGGGLKVPINDNWAIRTDARWFNGLGRDAGEHWRIYDGVTFRTGRR